MTGDTRVASTLSPVEIAFTTKTEAPKTQNFRPICQESDAEHVDVFFTYFRGVFPRLEQVSLGETTCGGPHTQVTVAERGLLGSPLARKVGLSGQNPTTT